jgi:hypothetical protein
MLPHIQPELSQSMRQRIFVKLLPMSVINMNVIGNLPNGVTYGFDALQQPINVHDEEGILLGEYLADLYVQNSLIVELKTARALAPEHEAQILGYLKSAKKEHGLLINFGSFRFQIRKFALSDAQDRAVVAAIGQ